MGILKTMKFNTKHNAINPQQRRPLEAKRRSDEFKIRNAAQGYFNANVSQRGIG
jgi:hypothetical protein